MFSVDFDYPDYDQEFMEPKPASVKPENTRDNDSSNIVINGDTGVKPISMPTVDRSKKPTVDRSTKINVTKIQVTSADSSNQNSIGASSLYPDVRATVSNPSANQNRSFTNADARAPVSYNSNTDSRAGVHSSRTVITSIPESQSNSSLSDDLQDLDRQKKIKEQELANLKRESERVQEESRFVCLFYLEIRYSSGSILVYTNLFKVGCERSYSNLFLITLYHSFQIESVSFLKSMFEKREKQDLTL